MSEVVVVDASVALKWVLLEADSDRAKSLLDRWTSERELLLPLCLLMRLLILSIVKL